MPFADVDGVKIYHEHFGQGPDVVAVSGLLSTTVTSQFHLVPGLTQQYRLLSADHRGGGQSDVPAPPYTIDQIADDWLAVMDATGIERAPVIGNSMGSMVATSIALRHPERVSALVLSVPITHADPYVAGVLRQWFDINRSQGPASFARETLLWCLTPAGFNKQAALIEQVLAGEMPEIPEDGFAGQMAALLAYDQRHRLRDIQVPTLVIAGAQDRICPPTFATEIAALIDGSELVIIDDTGHLPQTEQPERYAAALLPFLDQHHRSA